MNDGIRWLKDNSIANPVVDAIADIDAGKPMRCVVGTGYAGYKTVLEDGNTSSLDHLRIKYSFGRIGCTGPAIDITSDDELYARLYNQTTLDTLFPS